MVRRWSLVAVAAGALLVLSACTTPPITPSDTAEETVTATPSPSPTPEVPEVQADFGFTFFHEGTIGSTFAQLSEQLHYPVGGMDECPYFGAVWSTDLATTYAFTDVSNPDAGVQFFYANRFLAPDDAPFPRNAEDVGIGSTQDEVVAAYPDAVVDAYQDLSAGELTRITVEDPDSDARYVFALSSGSAVVDLLQWGTGNFGGQWGHLCGGL
jgi:hypothetical protein